MSCLIKTTLYEEVGKMVEVYVYVINGMVTVEDKNRNVLHRMSGFGNELKVKTIIEALTNMYVVLEVYD